LDALFGEGVVGQEPLVGEEVEKELFELLPKFRTC
jgi:hypothetical protein